MAPVTDLQCEHNREICSDKQAAIIAAAVSKGLAPVARLEGKVDAIAEQLSGLPKLYERVGELEKWKGFLDGRAAALSETPQAHHRPDDEVERTHQRAADKVAEAAVVAADKVALAATNAIAKVSAAAVAARDTATNDKLDHDPPIKLTWKTGAVVAVFILTIIYAIASDRAREVLQKPPHLVPNVTVTK